MKKGIELITEERDRQLEKWDATHDDDHAHEELACAAAHMLESDEITVQTTAWSNDEGWITLLYEKHQGDRIKMLTIAGALIAAEIDRLNRSKPSE